MKTIAAILLLSCCALSQDQRAISRAEVGCGPQDVKYEVKFDDSQHPTPTPEDGKALIYVVADGDLTSVFGVDEKWEGAVKGGRAPSTGAYFFVPTEPGEHHVCAMLQSSHPLLPGFGVPGGVGAFIEGRAWCDLLFQDSHGGDQYRVRSSTSPVGFGRRKVVCCLVKV